MKLFKILNQNVHDHHIVLIIFSTVIILTYLNVDHNNKNNCHILEPDINCQQKGIIPREYFYGINYTHYVFIPHDHSLYAKDEFREKPEFGTLHALFNYTDENGTYHFDMYNGVVGPLNIFNTVGHFANSISTLCWYKGIKADDYSCQGIPDFMAVLIFWGTVLTVPYYTVRVILQHRKSILSHF